MKKQVGAEKQQTLRTKFLGDRSGLVHRSTVRKQLTLAVFCHLDGRPFGVAVALATLL
jgi:hypothetical protein